MNYNNIKNYPELLPPYEELEKTFLNEALEYFKDFDISDGKILAALKQSFLDHWNSIYDQIEQYDLLDESDYKKLVSYFDDPDGFHEHETYYIVIDFMFKYMLPLVADEIFEDEDTKELLKYKCNYEDAKTTEEKVSILQEYKPDRLYIASGELGLITDLIYERFNEFDNCYYYITSDFLEKLYENIEQAPTYWVTKYTYKLKSNNVKNFFDSVLEWGGHTPLDEFIRDTSDLNWENPRENPDKNFLSFNEAVRYLLDEYSEKVETDFEDYLSYWAIEKQTTEDTEICTPWEHTIKWSKIILMDPEMPVFIDYEYSFVRPVIFTETK